MPYYKTNYATDKMPNSFTIQLPISMGYYSRSTTGTTGAGVIFYGNINTSTGSAASQTPPTGTLKISGVTYQWKAVTSSGGYQRFETDSNKGNATGLITITFTRINDAV